MHLVASPSAVLWNEGLDSGVRVTLDDRPDDMATVCFTESDAAYCWVRLDRTSQRVRVESWRLACVG
jgi:hypothetical protein